MDTIFIYDLKIKTIIGVHEFEKKIQQTLYLNLELQTDLSKARSDKLNDTIDYSQIATTIQDFCVKNHFNLIECLAEHLITTLLEQFPKIQQITLTLKKPGAITNAQAVGVKITRNKL